MFNFIHWKPKFRYDHFWYHPLFFLCLFFLFFVLVCFGFFFLLGNFHRTCEFLSQKQTSPSNLNLWPALMAIEHLGLFNVPHLICQLGGYLTHQLPNVWQWSWQYMFNNSGLSRLEFELSNFTVSLCIINRSRTVCNWSFLHSVRQIEFKFLI